MTQNPITITRVLSLSNEMVLLFICNVMNLVDVYGGLESKTITQRQSKGSDNII